MSTDPPSLTKLDELRSFYHLPPYQQPTAADTPVYSLRDPYEAREIIAALMRLLAGKNANEVPVVTFCQRCDDVLHNERGCAKGCPCHTALRYLGITD